MSDFTKVLTEEGLKYVNLDHVIFANPLGDEIHLELSNGGQLAVVGEAAVELTRILDHRDTNAFKRNSA